MEGVINPLKNPELSLKKKYGKRLLVQLDEELFFRMRDEVDTHKSFYNSVSHFIRCAIIQKLDGVNEDEITKKAYLSAVDELMQRIGNK